MSPVRLAPSVGGFKSTPLSSSERATHRSHVCPVLLPERSAACAACAFGGPQPLRGALLSGAHDTGMDLLSRPFFVADADWVAVALDEADAPALQVFLDANPLYSEIVNGRPFQPGEARQEIVDRPPFAYRAAHALAVLDRREGRWRGFVSLVDDLIAPGVQHIGLFLMATADHGKGLASSVYQAVEARARRLGMRWMRLGVVLGNARAEAFWQRQGFVELRQRHGLPYEGLSTSVRVMAKPLHAKEGDWSAFWEAVPRDRPDSP